MSVTDNQLIAEFNERRSEEAFTALVRHHVNLVFATAMRQVGDAGAAEEITQNVFVALAQGAGKLGSHPTIAGWLYQATLNKSREWLRAELRRRRREQTAVELELAGSEGDSVWSSLVPLLDDALLDLRESDRLAVILHFMEGRTFCEVGAALGVGEDAARKRVNNCLQQLTDFFRRQGFTVPALSMGAPLFTLALHPAPAGLASSATAAGFAGAHSTTSTFTLVKGALKIMAWSKANTAVVAGVVILLAAATTTVTVKKGRQHSADEAWRTRSLDSQLVNGLAPETEILPSKFSPDFSRVVGGRRGKVAGIGTGAAVILSEAYGMSAQRMVLPITIPPSIQAPQSRYDFICTLQANQKEALQHELKKQLGLVGTREMHDTDVLLLEVESPNAPKLNLSNNRSLGGTSQSQPGHYTCTNAALTNGLTASLEFYLNTPVIDATGLNGRYDIDLTWDEPNAPFRNYNDWQHRNIDGLKEALQNQLGLELVPTNMPIEMLSVEKVN